MYEIHYDNGPHYSRRLTQAKTKALTSHGKYAQAFMLEKSVVQSYTMVMNGGVIVDGTSTLSSSLKKDTYAEVVARKPWKGFKIAGQITKPKKATVEEKRMKGKQLLLAPQGSILIGPCLVVHGPIFGVPQLANPTIKLVFVYH